MAPFRWWAWPGSSLTTAELSCLAVMRLALR